MTDYIADIMTKKINGKYLVSTISGAWDVLDSEEYNLLITNRLQKNKDLYKRLAEEGIVITKENVELIKARIRQRYSFLCRPVDLHIIVVTNRCTHQCVYCHAKPADRMQEDTQDMDKNTADKVASFILSAPNKAISVEFQGGESLLNMGVVKHIISKLNKDSRKIIYKVATNLSEMTNDIFDGMMKMGVKLVSSLDGPKKLHDKNRCLGLVSSYDNVIKWFRYSRERFNQNIGLLPTITRYSFKFGVKKIIDEYVKNKIYDIRLRELNFSGSAASLWQKIGYSAEEFFDFWKKGLNYCLSLYDSGIPIKEGMTTILLQRLLSPSGGDYMCCRTPCGAGINQLSYGPDGNIYICDNLRGYGNEAIIGNVRNITYKKSLEKTKGLRERCNIINSCRQCVWSPYCGTCLLGAIEQSNGFISIKARDFYCKLRQKQLEYIINLLLGKHKETLLEWWAASKNSTSLNYHPQI